MMTSIWLEAASGMGCAVAVATAVAVLLRVVIDKRAREAAGRPSKPFSTAQTMPLGGQEVLALGARSWAKA